ncbi:aldo/keto reductase [Niveibacterium sp. SC-1]|uniref:aldo/keto reductase n=1 Tax=Niveibacterium sp. SC-1 TaxID=3135646 RepID=UPI00311F79DD
MNIPRRPFGNSGLTVSALGFGAGQIGDEALPEDQVGQLLNRALDLGINLLDTARGYGVSEARIGRHLAHRRGEFVLSTKVGYGIPGYADWTYECILAGIDTALGLMRTDVIDIVHLHSCPLQVLQQGAVIDALDRAREAGKIRVAAYSGENAELEWAATSGRFGSLQCSMNLCDQRALRGPIAQASARDIGVIAKRAVANAPWRFDERPHGHYCEEYWHRWKTLAIDPQGLDWQELAIRYSAFAPGVGSAIIGTTSATHLERNIGYVARGPLDDALRDEIDAAFQRHDQNWTGQL